jgi:uncharacterized protein YjiS (DUF1127 family)
MMSIGRSQNTARTPDRAFSAVFLQPDAFRRALLAASAQAIGWLRARHQMRRAIRELAALDDHMLADIGLSRGAVMYAVVHGRFPKRQDRW